MSTLRFRSFAVALLAPALISAARPPVPYPKPRMAVAPPKPESHPQAQSEPIQDLSHAIPAKDASKLPSTREQLDTLRQQIVHDRPAVINAQKVRDQLKAETLALQKKLIATAARVVDLESEKVALDADIARLSAEDSRLSAGFARDRISVAHLLAVLERMQHDLPPAIVFKPDDALGAARSAMLVGASVPYVYSAAAALARRIETLQKTRALLVARRLEGLRNAQKLRAARTELDQLLATRELQADVAESRYSDLAQKLAAAASTAADLHALLERVAALRAEPAQKSVVVVEPERATAPSAIRAHSLLRPVAGTVVPGGIDGVGGPRAPGLTYATSPGARVIAPADSQVVFAGPYHKTGQLLILELAAGYDLVLAGLGRIDVRTNDEVLAGEPVGIMPKSGRVVRLYFELRQNGHGTDPAPWLAAELRKAQKS